MIPILILIKKVILTYIIIDILIIYYEYQYNEEMIVYDDIEDTHIEYHDLDTSLIDIYNHS